MLPKRYFEIMLSDSKEGVLHRYSMVGSLLRPRTTIGQSQLGINLIEMVVAVAILAAVGVAFMAGLSGAFRAQDITEEQINAENVAQASLEDIRNQPYNTDAFCYPSGCYTVSVVPPPGYSIAVETQQYCTPEPCTPPDNNIQQNTVTVSRDGVALANLTDLKARR